jgi:L-fuculose-phosphate aldolase
MTTTKEKQRKAILHEKLKQAFMLAKEGKYEKARYLLHSIDDHPKAQELLQRLEGLEEKSKPKAPVSAFAVIMVIFVVVALSGSIAVALFIPNFWGQFSLAELAGIGASYEMSEQDLLEWNLLSYCQIETYFSESCEGWTSRAVSNHQAGSDMLGVKLAETFAMGHHVVLLENHGVVAVGASLNEAFLRLDTAALVAEISLNAYRLGEIFCIETAIQQAIIGNKVEDKVAGDKIAAFAKRAVKRHMMGRAVGHVSSRFETGFLITPSIGDRESFVAEDIVFVSDSPLDNIALLIAAIYEKHLEIEAIMLSQAPYATAFAITHQKIDTRSIPEAYLTLLDVPTLAFDIDHINNALSERSPVIIIENYGALVTGKTLLQMFDRLEVLEYAARSAIESQLLGSVKPLSPEAIRDLEESYHHYYKGLSG